MHRVLRPLAVALAVGVLVPLPAQRPDSAAVLPDLEVTVGRTATPLAVFGGAVSLVSGSAITRYRLATGLDEALAFVPGVLTANRSNPSLDQRLVIRGFGARANFGVRGVKILIDGVPQTLPDGQSQLTNLDLTQMAQVEVLRGAASSLHGNAAGGVVAFTTRVGPARQGVAFQAGSERGTFGTHRLQAGVGYHGPRVRAEVAGSRYTTDGFRMRSANEQRRLGAHLDLALTPTVTLTARGYLADDPRAQNPGALTLAEADVDPSAVAPNNLRRRADKAVRQRQVAVGLDHGTGRWEVGVRTWHITRDPENPLAAPAPAPTTADEGLWIGIDRAVLGLRSTVTRRFVGGGRASAGLDVQQGRDDRINRRHLTGTPFGPALVDQRETVLERGAFVQLDLPVRSGLAVRTGVRRDAVRFDVEDRLAPGQGGTRTMSATTAHGGVTWRHRATTAWASAATAFETPTTTELGNRPDGSTGLNADLDPQMSTSLELGLRTRVQGASVELAAWTTRTDDAITPFQEVGGRSFFVNAGATRTRGVEAAATLPLSGSLIGLATWTFTDARFRRYTLVTDGEARRLDGNRVPGIPAQSVRLGVRGLIGRVVVDLDHALVSTQYADDANTQQVDGWGTGVTGVRATTAFDAGGGASIEPFVAIQNLWARRYVGSVTVNGGFGRVAEPAPGRVVSVGVRVGWQAR